MNIAVLSGKGGTGKTTISVNLAKALKANYIDCDVEEPNGFIFLNPVIDVQEKVKVETPHINTQKCTLCQECVQVCQFNALLNIQKDIIVFPNLCHSCGACEIVCEQDALHYTLRETGKIEKGKAKEIKCIAGTLNVGEPMAGPVIRQLMKQLSKELNIIDCSPGTSCNVVHTLKYSDGAILVTEPTMFGLHDLQMAVQLVKMFKMPFGIIINKDDEKENMIEKYCVNHHIDLIGRIPYKKEIAKLYSSGQMLYDSLEYKDIIDDLSKKAREVLKWS